MQRISYLLFAVAVGSVAAADYDAQAYHASNMGQFKHAMKEMHLLNLSGSEKVLDIGSGDGRISLYIAQEYLPRGQLFGIDASSDMVVFASLHSKAENVSYAQADILEYASSNEFDAIVSFWTLHWISDYKKALCIIARSLKPGGKALLCHYVGPSNPLQMIVNKLLESEKWKGYKSDTITLFNTPSFVQVADALEQSGLIIDSFEIKKNGEPMLLKMVKKNLLSTPLFDFIPADLRADFCDDVLQTSRNEKNEIAWQPVVVMVLRKPL